MSVELYQNNERKLIKRSFGPFYASDACILILGSFPSPKSREANFFYGHPQNRFWKVLAAVFNENEPKTLDEKKLLLVRNRIALYDVVESCSIIGASDNSISDVVPTNLKPILQSCNIENRIYTNGRKAYDLYMKYIYPETNISATKLPSTSPANAAYSRDKLVKIWSLLLPNPIKH